MNVLGSQPLIIPALNAFRHTRAAGCLHCTQGLFPFLPLLLTYTQRNSCRMHLDPLSFSSQTLLRQRRISPTPFVDPSDRCSLFRLMMTFKNTEQFQITSIIHLGTYAQQCMEFRPYFCAHEYGEKLPINYYCSRESQDLI